MVKRVLFFGVGLIVSLQILSARDLPDPLPAESLPATGNFYSAQNTNLPPLPFNVNQLPGWNLGNGNYLLDDIDYSAASRGRRTLDDSGPPSPFGFGDGDGDTNTYVPYVIPTNGLCDLAAGWHDDQRQQLHDTRNHER
jgi:hypothetical protein